LWWYRGLYLRVQYGDGLSLGGAKKRGYNHATLPPERLTPNRRHTTTTTSLTFLRLLQLVLHIHRSDSFTPKFILPRNSFFGPDLV
jgi:hypothetical protein